VPVTGEINLYKNMVRRPEGKVPLGKYRFR
jgi:hypothetical protein